MSENRRIHLRVGTAAEWSTHNPVLGLGEPGYESDTKILRIGNGSANFLLLAGLSIEGDTLINAIAALTTAANQLIYLTGSNTVAVTSLTAAGRALIDDADAPAQLVTLGLTATAAELNTLQGITASVTELNLLGGIASLQTTLTDTDTSLPTSGAVVEHVAGKAIGIGQIWQNFTASRVANVNYQNTTGRPISIHLTFRAGVPANVNQMQFSADGVTFVQTGNLNGDNSDTDVNVSFIIPDQHFYAFLGTGATSIVWLELR